MHLRAFRARFSYHLDPVLSYFVSSWECLEISTSLSICWITFCLVALDSFSYLMSLACFLPKAFLSLSWFGTSFHFAITCLMLWDMLVDHDHIFTPYTYHGPSTPFFVRSLIQFSTRCSHFHYGKVKDMFSHSHFFLGIRLDHLIIFLRGTWIESWVKDTQL